KMDPTDPATAFILGNLRGGNPTAHAPVLATANLRFKGSLEAKLALANNQIEGALTAIDPAKPLFFAQAERYLLEVEEVDAYDWRVIWYRGVSFLAQQDFGQALEAFETCYREVPGELAVKLAMAIAYECNRELGRAIKYYDVVSRTNPDFATAV